jgi:hypothetical protein
MVPYLYNYLWLIKCDFCQRMTFSFHFLSRNIWNMLAGWTNDMRMKLFHQLLTCSSVKSFVCESTFNKSLYIYIYVYIYIYIYIYICSIYILLHFFPTPPPSQWCSYPHPLGQNLFRSLVLRFSRRKIHKKEKEKHGIFASLR